MDRVFLGNDSLRRVVSGMYAVLPACTRFNRLFRAATCLRVATVGRLLLKSSMIPVVQIDQRRPLRVSI